jgi:hypothetical protein
MFAGGAEAIGRGQYADGRWEVSTVGKATDAASRMVTLHEIMHAELNDSTAWGSLFHAYAALARYAPRPEDFREASLDVIGACRRSHEVFATYTGVFLADPAAGRSLLAGRPEYLAYYSDACLLAAGITDGTQLQWYAVISAIRACMQSHGLPEALSVGLDRFQLSDLRARDLPDARLDMLMEEGTAAAEGLADDIAARLAPDEREAGLRWLTAPPGDSADDISQEVQDHAAAIAERACFDRAVAALEGRGARVLGYNGHQDYTGQTVAAVHELAPAARDTFSAAPADATETGMIMQDFGLERLRVRDAPLPARVLRLADVPRRQLRPALRLQGPAGDYTFLVARSSGALRSQHAIAADSLRPLPSDDSAPVVAVRITGGTPQEPSLWLYQVGSPRELNAVRRRVGGVGVVSSVSMSLLADPKWEGRWLAPLMRSGPVTILMDLNPWDHFAHWAGMGLQVRYCCLEAGAGSESRIGFACVCRDPAGQLGYEQAVFLTVCTDLQADALTVVLRERWPQLAQEDQDVARDRLPVLSVVLSHLIAEETYFSFTGVASLSPTSAGGGTAAPAGAEGVQ